jgi:hypothetical protein
MFVYIGRQFVNMLCVEGVDEGREGQLRLNLVSGKTIYARQPDEIEQVQGALKQLAYSPKTEPAVSEKKPARKVTNE